MSICPFPRRPGSDRMTLADFDRLLALCAAHGAEPLRMPDVYISLADANKLAEDGHIEGPIRAGKPVPLGKVLAWPQPALGPGEAWGWNVHDRDTLQSMPAAYRAMLKPEFLPQALQVPYGAPPPKGAATAIYDNPRSRRRERWTDGRLVAVITDRVLGDRDFRLACRDHELCIGPWEPGCLKGDPFALAPSMRPRGRLTVELQDGDFPGVVIRIEEVRGPLRYQEFVPRQVHFQRALYGVINGFVLRALRR
ncbi:MAG: hypothetical protein ACREVL_16530 [Solimonas sp.]